LRRRKQKRASSKHAREHHALALTERTGQRWNEADTHRTRGEILFHRDPANMAPTEDAFLTAIAIAQQQKARSFELRAALSLAKLYRQRTDPPTPCSCLRSRTFRRPRNFSWLP